MSTKRQRIINQEKFLPTGADAFSSRKKRAKPPKDHQLEEKLVPSSVSSKILKVALSQQKEIQREEDNDNNVAEQNPSNNFSFPSIHGLKDDDGDDVDDFEGFSDTQSQFGNFEDDIDEDDEKLLEAFLSKEDRPERTLADIIVDRIKEKDAQVSSGVQPMPKLDDSIIELYKGVGKLLSKYTTGKLPKAFKHVPSLQFWEEVLHLTEPDKWSPNAMYQATRIFASNMGVKKAERFYKLVLLPRVREDIRKNKRLHFALYQSLKKALYKPAAFNKGILFSLCELEIQKLLDEHKSILAEKQKEFDLETEQKRLLNDELLKDKAVEVEKREAEVKHKEDKIKKREQAIEMKMEKVRERELDYDSKSKALKGREKSLMVEEKNLENERKELLAEKKELLAIKDALENIRTDTEKLRLRLNEEREQLKVTEDERKEHARLQAELKEEIDKYRFQSEQLMKEADDLKQEKGKFEKEWEELDDKREKIKQEQDDVLEQKSCFEKLRQIEQERLHNEKLETEQFVQRELEALRLAKDSFAASMEHEKSMLIEKLENEKSKLIHDFEMQKQEFEAKMQTKKEEMENSLNEREKSFEQEKEMELSNVNYLREVAKREMEEMKLERQKIEREKVEISQNKQHVEAQQTEMKKDIEELVSLSMKLKDQREQFIKERERFIVFAEKQKNCSMCGETIREFVLSDLHLLAEMKNLEAPPLPTVADAYLKKAVEGTSSPVLANSGSPAAAGTVSWLRKCTSKIFKFSPGKKLEMDDAQGPEGSLTLPMEQVVDPSLQVANDSVDVEITDLQNTTRDVETAQAHSDDQDPSYIPENSQNSNLKMHSHGPVKRRSPMGGRTRAGKDDFAGSKTNGDVENSVHTNDDPQAESNQILTGKNRRKRDRFDGSQPTVSDSQTEANSESTKDGDYRTKRRKRVVVGLEAKQNPGQKRYNLRRSNRSVGTVANGSLPQARKDKEMEAHQQRSSKANLSENVEVSEAPREEANKSEGAVAASRKSARRDADELVRSTAAVSEFSAESPAMFKGTRGTTSRTFEDYRGLSEEVGEREDSGEDFRSESREEGNNDGDGDEVDHPGEKSIGKKLWTFLTT